MSIEPRPQFEIAVGGRPVRLGRRTLIMGVLNVTPDSFSDGGRYLDPARAVERGIELAREGADWIDVGGESTRPGAEPVSEEEERRRVLPVIRALRRKLPATPISIDTTKARVAELALEAGASILNDVSGLRFDARMAEVAARYRAALILMHMRRRPRTMQQGPFPRDIWRSVEGGLERSLGHARVAGVKRSQIILDPGLGFGKSRRQNYEILAALPKLSRFRLPVLVGSSRKSFIQAIVAGEGLEPALKKARRARYWPISRDEEGTRKLEAGESAALAAAVLGGAHIVRVHDPRAALPAIRIADTLLAAIRAR